MRYLSLLISVFSISFLGTYTFLHLSPSGEFATALRSTVSSATYQSVATVGAIPTPAVAATEVEQGAIVVVEEVPPEPVFSPSDVTWELATATAEWLPRDSAASFVFNDKMWIMGGLNGNGVTTSDEHAVHYWEATHFNDVWSSEDGITWRQEAEHAAWPARRSMSVAPFKGKLWMLGGWSPVTGYAPDIWQSDDGVTWKRVMREAPWEPREGQTLEVFNGKLWLIGGVNYDERDVKNDVWYSDDGLTWKEVKEVPWSPRWDHATVVFADKIFLAGGMDLSRNTFRDVWTSIDGINWVLATDAPLWESRQGHGLAVFEDRLWSVGRLNDDEGGGDNDVWYSRDGVQWRKTANDPEWPGREDHAVLTFKGDVYVLGGMDADWKWRNDVWKMGVKKKEE